MQMPYNNPMSMMYGSNQFGMMPPPPPPMWPGYGPPPPHMFGMQHMMMPPMFGGQQSPMGSFYDQQRMMNMHMQGYGQQQYPNNLPVSPNNGQLQPPANNPNNYYGNQQMPTNNPQPPNYYNNPTNQEPLNQATVNKRRM